MDRACHRVRGHGTCIRTAIFEVPRHNVPGTEVPKYRLRTGYYAPKYRVLRIVRYSEVLQYSKKLQTEIPGLGGWKPA